MHTRPDKEADLDSSGARFEAAEDLNGGRVDEEATWFCSDAMAEVAGNLYFDRPASERVQRAISHFHRLSHLWT